MTTPPMITQRTKPSWWYPLPCKDCFGWLSFRNRTLKMFCSWGCGKRTTAQPLTTTTQATSESIPSTVITVSKIPTDSHQKQIKRNGRLEYSSKSINLHINYIWLLVGVVSVGFITTVLLIVRKYTSNKRKVGTITNSNDVVVRIGEPFIV